MENVFIIIIIIITIIIIRIICKLNTNIYTIINAYYEHVYPAPKMTSVIPNATQIVKRYETCGQKLINDPF
jgi:hypothetical protein